MRRVAVVLIVILAACVLPGGLTFDEIAAPYLDEHGEPSMVYTSTAGGGLLVTWIWEGERVVTFGWNASGIYEAWEVVREIEL